MKISSLDPRVMRAEIPQDINEQNFSPKEELDQYETYEVFQQVKRGGHYGHVGSVHAPNAEIAMLFARDQYARRGKCIGLWVVRTRDIMVIDAEDGDIFEQNFDKSYREASGYRVMNKLNEFKKGRQAQEVENGK